METWNLFQDWVTLTLPERSLASVVQCRERQIDAADMRSVEVYVEVVSISPAIREMPILILETAVSQEGPWYETWSTRQTDSKIVPHATHYRAERKLLRFLRWRLAGTASSMGPQSVTFRLRFR